MKRVKTVGYSAARAGRGWVLLVAVIVGFVVVGVVEYVVINHVMSPEPRTAAGGGDVPGGTGVPVSQRRTPAGAASAAQNFQIAGFRVAAGTLDSRHAVAALLDPGATPTAAAVLAAPTQPQDQLARQRLTYAPLSTVVEAFDPDRAQVSVWGVAAQSSRMAPQPGGTEDWGRSTITLRWDGAQWRVTDQRFESGPWPVRSEDRLTDADGDFAFRFRESVQGWAYVPDA
ncbi:hypothetical protein [Amycolatopsis tucumanensis]|uniref:Integral membrane protein n=1 Tax=Amycolatopsis tucumanensis TaxID=401106 RepID=A0ABP7HDB4_9PSEU|nr:hypothetical protein [Amycolatopsis tucumanensis]MCF6423673.1 hypothetical protein [Amycolatopsis tucumanensis]